MVRAAVAGMAAAYLSQVAVAKFIGNPQTGGQALGQLAVRAGVGAVVVVLIMHKG